jgi:hypothetical protein
MLALGPIRRRPACQRCRSTSPADHGPVSLSVSFTYVRYRYAHHLEQAA